METEWKAYQWRGGRMMRKNEVIEGEVLECAFCKGSGKAYPRTNIACPACFGKGVASVSTKDIETCPTCKGRGRKVGSSLPCLTCRGKGVISK